MPRGEGPSARLGRSHLSLRLNSACLSSGGCGDRVLNTGHGSGGSSAVKTHLCGTGRLEPGGPVKWLTAGGRPAFCTQETGTLADQGFSNPGMHLTACRAQ